MEEAYQLVSKAAKASAKRGKELYDGRCKGQNCILAAEFSSGTWQKEVGRGNSDRSGKRKFM